MRRLFLIPLLCCFGCAPSAPTERTTEARGGLDGEEDPRPERFRLVVGSNCTALALAPYAFLTSYRCLNEEPSNGLAPCATGNPIEGLALATDRPMTIDASFEQPPPEVAVTEVLAPMEAAACGQDLVLLVTETPVEGIEAVVPRVDQPVLLAELTNVSAVSLAYGMVEYPDDDDGVVPFAGGVTTASDLVVSCIGDSCDDEAIAEGEWVVGDSICPFDHPPDVGAGAFDDVGRLIGVGSRTASNECRDGIYADVYGVRAWLSEAMNEAAAVHDAEPPPWTQGASTDPAYSAPVGDACDVASECVSGICEDGQCTRQCRFDAPCPEGWRCGDEGVCESDEPTVPEAEPSDGCTATGRRPGGTTPWWLLGLLLWRRRRR